MLCVLNGSAWCLWEVAARVFSGNRIAGPCVCWPLQPERPHGACGGASVRRRSLTRTVGLACLDTGALWVLSLCTEDLFMLAGGCLSLRRL